MYLLLKCIISGALIGVISEVARRSSTAAAILTSLPVTSILAMIWLYRDTGDTTKVAALSTSIAWMVVPSVIFFIVMSMSLKREMGFWPALGLASLIMAIAYPAYTAVLARVGIG
jgi:hypothetical protein